MKLFSLLLITLCTINGEPDWPAFRGNTLRSGYTTDYAGIPSRTPSWVMHLGGPVISSPAIVGDNVIIGANDSCIYKINAKKGTLLWKHRTGGMIASSPFIWGDSIVVGGSDGKINIVKRSTGDSIGSIDAGFQLSSPAVLSDGSLLTGMGVPLNNVSMIAQSGAWSIYFSQTVYSSPAVAGNMAVVGSGEGILYGIHLVDRTVRWSVPTKGGVYLSTPAIFDSIAYFAPGDDDRNVYAVDLINGKQYWKSGGLWNEKLQKQAAFTQINTLALQQLARLNPYHRMSMLYQLKKQGIGWTVLFEKTAPAAPTEGFVPDGGGIKTSSVAVDSQRVYVVQKEIGYSADSAMKPLSRFTLLALDAFDGKELWHYSDLRTSERIGYCSSPIVTRDKVFVGWGEGKVYAFDSRTGNRLWEDSLDGHIVSSPAIASHQIFFATMNGSLYCFNVSGTPPGLDFQRSTYCYPNPARKGVSHIQVYVQREAALDVTVYNIAERPVFRETRRLSAEEQYTYDWDLKNVANGVYFARIVVRYNDGGTDKKVLKIAVLK